MPDLEETPSTEESDIKRVPERPQRSWIRRMALPVAVFLICVGVYVSLHAIFMTRTDVFRTDGDEVQYLVLTESIIDDFDLSPLDEYTEKVYRDHGYYSGDIPAPALVDGYGGRLAYAHLPTMSVLLLPGFWLFGYQGAAATMILLTALGAAFMFSVLRRLVSPRLAFAMTLMFFLTYPLVTYSRLIYTETVMLFLLPVALWACLRLSETGQGRFALTAGLASGLMLMFHVKFAAVSVAVLALLWTCSRAHRRDVIAWAVPVVVGLAAVTGMTLYLYGPNLVHGFTVSSGPGGFLGGGPFWGIFGLYLDRAWGLFIFAPLYFVFLPGVPRPRKEHLSRWWSFVPLVIVLYTLSVGLFGKWSGEVSPVPRHLVPLLPILTLCAAVFYASIKGKVVKALVWALLAVQVVWTVFALIYPMSVFAIHGQGNDLIHRILGDTLARFVVGIFPLFHPVRFKSGILLLVIWLVFLGAISWYMRSKEMRPLEEALALGGQVAG